MSDKYTSNKHRTAQLLRRIPFVVPAAMAVYRLTQPHMTVGAVGTVFNSQGQLLIVEHVFHPVFPWGLPGGWMGRGENPDETVRRELQEETGLHINILKPLAVTRTDFIPGHLDVSFLCELPESPHQEIKLSDELLDYRWVDPTDLPPMANFHVLAVERAVAERNNWRQNQA